MTDVSGMFNNALSFNGDIFGMFRLLANMNSMFENESFSGDLSNWDVSSVLNMGKCLQSYQLPKLSIKLECL